MIYLKSLILSIMLGISCREYYEAILPRRKMKRSWMEHTSIMAFVFGFWFIAVSPIPPYVFMPIRVIVIVWMAGQIYYSVTWTHNLVLSVFFCGIVWVFASIVVSAFYILRIPGEIIENILDPVWCSILLFAMMLFSYKCKGKLSVVRRKRWVYFGFFPLFSIIILMIMGMENRKIDYNIQFLFIIGFCIVSILIFYFIVYVLLKDSYVQSVRMENELIRSQMSLYQSMEQNYRQQQTYMHDYKNQLGCIQGLLENEKPQEAIDYIRDLTGGIWKSTDYVDTNHVIVNVILNQKYQYAQENGITMIISVNDLSGLVMAKEDLVVLLSNLLDNAVEACRKLTENKMIQFKMVMEKENLILSVKNPVQSVPEIHKGKVLSSKKNRKDHGIGLTNVESVVRRNHGISSIKFEDGYCFFSAMIPR